MKLRDIVSKKYDQFKYKNTAVMVSDYEARYILVDAVAYTINKKRIFESITSSKVGQKYIIHIPEYFTNSKNRLEENIQNRLDHIFNICTAKNIKILAFSISDICGKKIISEKLAKSIVIHIFKRICDKLELETVIICSKELENTKTVRQAILSLTAIMRLDENNVYKMIYPLGMEPVEFDKDGKIDITSIGIVRAGGFNTWVYKYTVGRSFVENAELAFAITHPSNWMVPQFAVSDAPGYTTVKTNGDAKILVSSRPACGNKGFIIQLKVIEGKLKKGEYIEIILGDKSFGSPGLKTQTRSMDKQIIKVIGDFADARKIPWQHNDFTYGLKTCPSFRITTGKPELFDLICPTNVVINKKFKGIVRLCDSVGNTCENVSFKGFLKIDNNDVRSICITPKDNAHIIIGDLRLRHTGIHRIIILGKNKILLGTSNPIICSECTPQYKMYWGDLHMHSNLSDGVCDPDYIYYYAKNIAGLDIAALADHDTIMAMHEGHWQKTIQLANKWHKNGEFVTLLGYEFTERKYGGDRNVYYLNDTGPLINSGYHRMHPFELYEKLSELKFKSMVIPHGVIEKKCWKYSDPRFCRLAEIYSTHGSSESYPCEHYYAPDYANYDIYMPESSYSDSFSYGLKMGVIGGTDDHGGQPGWGYSWHNYRGGIMGVLMEDLTRDDLWNALWERRIICTTGERIYLNMTVNGLVIGSEGHIDDKPEIEIEALGTDKIDMIEILRNEKIIHCFHGNGENEKYIYIDKNWNGKEAWYRCRLTQADGERAWTSPVWITRKMPAKQCH